MASNYGNLLNNRWAWTPKDEGGNLKPSWHQISDPLRRELSDCNYHKVMGYKTRCTRSNFKELSNTYKQLT